MFPYGIIGAFIYKAGLFSELIFDKFSYGI
jgi:hypothetical protein